MKAFCQFIFKRHFLVIALLISSFQGILSQEAQTINEYKPRSGQDGKDVIWVPTPMANVDQMLNIAQVGPGDFVIDLGSGDGRTVIEAAKRGASGRGIEFNPKMVELSKRRAMDEGVTDRVEFVEGDLFTADLSEATVISMFLLPSINLRLRPTLLKLKPGTRIVSNTFDMEEWVPDRRSTAFKDCNSYCEALMWIVPADVKGTWMMPEGELIMSQKFQIISGTLKKGGEIITITEAKLEGDQISFNANFEKYSGRVNGNTIEGTIVEGNTTGRWTATR